MTTANREKIIPHYREKDPSESETPPGATRTVTGDAAHRVQNPERKVK
jgi:hypothetical protein